MRAKHNIRTEDNRIACVYLLPPVGAVLSVDGKLIREASASRNRALSNTSWSVHPGSTVLPEPVPVDSRAEGHVVLDVDNDGVSVVRLYGRARILA